MDFKNQVELMRSLGGNAPSKKKNELKNILFTKKMNDNNTYGILQENHKYYIMKLNENKSPNDPESYEHIDGFLNKKRHEYKTYGSATKNLNFMEINLNESVETVKKSAKLANKLDSELEKDKKASKTPDFPPQEDFPLDNEKEPNFDDLGSDEEGAENDIDVTGDTDGGGEDMGDMDLNMDIDPNDPDVKSQIEKGVGKMAYVIRKINLEPIDTKTYLGTFISAFENHLKDLEVEDRKKISDKILRINQDPEKELETTASDIEENFNNFLKSHNLNEGIISKVNTKGAVKLLEAYYKEYNNIDAPQLKELVLKEGVVDSINELNLKNAAKALGKTMKKGVDSVVTKTKNAANKVASDVKTNYHSGQVNTYIEKIESASQKLKELIEKMNDSMGKSGNSVVNMNSLLTSIKNQMISKNKQVSLDKFKLNEDTDPANYEVDLENSYTMNDDGTEKKPDLADEIENDLDLPENIEMDTDEGVKVDVNGKEKTVTVSLKEEKLRKYINLKLQELSGKKVKINENVKKSKKLQKLDYLIEKEFNKQKKK